ncbi:MAG: type II secretion system F family protein [Deltaproteobacteria bacterium]|nr:type II secretion system F family protein [Deltaproteobacteria bacterium]MBW2020512.1 type II secretion system F family protein [Deltaproteobacteria bacterium]MBW2075457.1 type II secretion system F family protein [Deltaproteobacteria bacterium]RLB83460.1 MAG: type II secretion system F family protein [Deltaproteobacteria bacterium]
MPLFQYTTIDRSGSEVEETTEFPSLAAAAASLRAQGKLVTSVEEVAARPRPGAPAFEFSPLDYLSFIRSNDIVLFFRQLATLIIAGVTLSNGLLVLERQAKKRKMRKVIGRLRRDIEGGSSFRDALKRHPRIFSTLVVGMVQAGEASGMLDVILDRIATYLEDRATFRTQVITSFIYPTVVVVMSIGVIGFLVGFVIPKFVPIIKSMGAELPWNTQFLIDFADWSKMYGKEVLGGVAGFVAISVISYKYVAPLRYWTDRIKIRLPVVGPIFLHGMVVQFSANLSTLTKSGVSLTECLRIVRDAVGNEAAKEVITTMERRITRGENLSSPLRSASHIFPPMVADMVAVGEETGNMDTTLELAGGIHEKMLQTHVKRMNAMIEPALIIVLGSIVGFVAWALIAGVLTMYSRAG